MGEPGPPGIPGKKGAVGDPGTVVSAKEANIATIPMLGGALALHFVAAGVVYAGLQATLQSAKQAILAAQAYEAEYAEGDYHQEGPYPPQ